MEKLLKKTMIVLFILHWLSVGSSQGQITFYGSDTGKPTDKNKQEVYDLGGETLTFRVTECEKGVNYTKQEIQKLMNEVTQLKNETNELKNQLSQLKKSAPQMANTQTNNNSGVVILNRNTSSDNTNGIDNNSNNGEKQNSPLPINPSINPSVNPAVNNVKDYGSP